MKSKKLMLLALLISGLLVLAACSPSPSSEEPQEPPEPGSTEPVAYPYPDTNQVGQPDKPVSYPGPENAVAVDPYPGTDEGDVGESEMLTSADFSVLPSDRALDTGPVFIETTMIVKKASYPTQVELVIIGDLPTPCHQLRVITQEPDADGHIQIQAYSVSDPERMCVQVLKPFQATVPLGDFTEGNLTYSINDEFEGKIQIP